MKILIAYDSLYGNTRQVGQAIAKGFAPQVPDLVHVKDVTADHLRDINMLVLGSPTHGGNASKPMQQFMAQTIRQGLPAGTGVAVFDTSISIEEQGFFLRFIIKLFGFASRRMARLLQKKGITVTARESFFVLGKEGPLKTGELKRAEAWGATLLYP